MIYHAPNSKCIIGNHHIYNYWINTFNYGNHLNWPLDDSYPRCESAHMKQILADNKRKFQRIPFDDDIFEKMVEIGKGQFHYSSKKAITHYRELMMCIGCGQYVHNKLQILLGKFQQRLAEQQMEYKEMVEQIKNLEEEFLKDDENLTKTQERLRNIASVSPAGMRLEPPYGGGYTTGSFAKSYYSNHRYRDRESNRRGRDRYRDRR